MVRDDAKVIFRRNLTSIKKMLPKECSYLSPYKTSKGEFVIKAIVNGNSYYFSTPENLVFTKADITRLQKAILEKI